VGIKVQLRILFLSLSNTYETLIEQLHSEGHIVEQLTEHEGICARPEKATAIAVDKINRFYPTYVINNRPSLFLPAFSTNSIVIGNTEASANLELKKWETRQKAQELGFLLPEILEECTLSTVSTTHTNTVFLKPKGIDPWHCAWKIPTGTNIADHNNELSIDTPAYVEADVEHDAHIDCTFTICNGAYVIDQIVAHTSTGNDKILFNKSFTNWKTGSEYVTLTIEQKDMVTALFNSWLAYAATLGGNYQGCLAAGLKGENLYWYEQNSRKGTHTIFSGSGQDWLNSLTINPAESLKTHWDFNL